MFYFTLKALTGQMLTHAVLKVVSACMDGNTKLREIFIPIPVKNRYNIPVKERRKYEQSKNQKDSDGYF